MAAQLSVLLPGGGGPAAPAMALADAGVLRRGANPEACLCLCMAASM